MKEVRGVSLTSFFGKGFNVIKLKEIFSKQKTEEIVKARRIAAIIATTAAVVVVGVISGVLASGSKNVPTAEETVSTDIVSEDTSETENMTEETSVSTTTVKTTTTSLSTLKKTTAYNKEFVITGKTSSNPYRSAIAKAQTYETGDISKERHTVRNIDTGKLVTSDGFDILCQVVNGEMGPSFSTEALKAQAVAAYTTILYCESTDQIPELGLNANYSSKIENAVKSVEGLVCTYNGKIANTAFSASSAEITASSRNAWGGSVPYLLSVTSKYDSLASDYKEEKSLSQTLVQMNLSLRYGIRLSPDPEDWFKITRTYDGRYVKTVELCDGTEVTGNFIKSLFGLKSNAFIISYKDGKFTFTTYGYGHGVGMSQQGANYYAIKDGLKFDQILKHYYTGVKVELAKNAKKQESADSKKPSNSKITTAKKTTAKGESLATISKRTTTWKRITRKTTTTTTTTKNNTEYTEPEEITTAPMTEDENTEPIVTEPMTQEPEETLPPETDAPEEPTDPVESEENEISE